MEMDVPIESYRFIATFILGNSRNRHSETVTEKFAVAKMEKNPALERQQLANVIEWEEEEVNTDVRRTSQEEEDKPKRFPHGEVADVTERGQTLGTELEVFQNATPVEYVVYSGRVVWFDAMCSHGKAGGSCVQSTRWVGCELH